MNKLEFLEQLRKGLRGLPHDDMEERLGFYSEMIDDRMEEGLSEENAVSAAGTVDEIVAQAVAEIPLTKFAKERIRTNRRLKTWEIVLLALGSPIWLSLGIAAVAVILSLYLSLWAVIISLWSVFVSIAACFIGGVVACVVFTAGGNVASGLAVFSAGIVCAGLAIFIFYACLAVTKSIITLTKKITIWIKNRFIRKEVAQ